MKTLCFKGKFGYLEEEIHKGLVVLTSFETNDTEININRAIKKLLDLEKEKIVLVPFVHLTHSVVDKEKADTLFNTFVENCKKSTKVPIVKIPFGIEKEFHLYAPADNEAIKFMRF